MDQKQKQEKYQSLFFSSVLIITFFSFLLLIPKVRIRIFPQEKKITWNNFVNQVKKEGKINPQTYWEFREFYSPGYYTFQRAGLNQGAEQEVLAKIGLPIDQSSISIPFLEFQSPDFISLDSLTKTSKLEDVYKTSGNTGTVIYRNSNTKIIMQDDHNATIIFLLPISEMKKANGFFNYADPRDNNYIKGYSWLDVAEIKIP